MFDIVRVTMYSTTTAFELHIFLHSLLIIVRIVIRIIIRRITRQIIRIIIRRIIRRIIPWQLLRHDSWMHSRMDFDVIEVVDVIDQWKTQAAEPWPPPDLICLLTKLGSHRHLAGGRAMVALKPIYASCVLHCLCVWYCPLLWSRRPSPMWQVSEPSLASC